MAEERRAAAVTETLEFKAAVAAEVAKATAGMIKDEVAKILETLKGQGSDVSSSDKRFAETLAMAFAQLNEQGNGRKYVDPRVLRERGEAREKMKELLVTARKGGKIPSYRVVAKTLLDNQLVEPMWVDASHIAQPTEIDWPGVPNDAMVPINETAHEIHAAFLASIGSKPESVLGAVPDATLDLEYGVTSGGLVVKAGAIPRQNRRASEGRTLPEAGEGLSLHHKGAPGRYVEKRVLGSIAAPAMQTI
jgi:hypothetical protein